MAEQILKRKIQYASFLVINLIVLIKCQQIGSNEIQSQQNKIGVDVNQIVDQNQQQSKKEEIVYKLIKNYEQYSSNFKKMAGPNQTIQMTKYGTHKQICPASACKFYIYLYQPDSIDVSETVEEQIKTILITSGIHGNQYIGPMSLYYLYPLIKGNFRVIYFPVMNPSGFSRSSRLTYPNLLDPNRDYPIDNNIQCYETSATRIVDKIFRMYAIDLTINLHNGASEIGWNWGTFSNKINSHTVEYDIFLGIGQMLTFYGGYNSKLNIKEFSIGTMNQVVYPAEGTLDDWAYAGSWDKSVPKSCQNYQYQPYPPEMHKGLVFLFELGRHNAPQNTFGTSDSLQKNPNSTQNSNGYVARTLRMLQKLVLVVNPQLIAILDSQKMLLYVQIIGCRVLEEGNFSIYEQELLLLKKSAQKQSFSKELNNSFINHLNLSLQLENSIMDQDSLKIHYEIGCDYDWIGKGETIFAKKRIFKGKISLRNQTTNETSLIQKQEEQLICIRVRLVYYFIISFLLCIVTWLIFRNKRSINNNYKTAISKQEAENRKIIEESINFTDVIDPIKTFEKIQKDYQN